MTSKHQASPERDERIGPSDVLERALPPAPAPSVIELDALFARVEGAVREERGPRAWLRSRPTLLRWTLAALLVLSLVLVELLLKPRVDFEFYPTLRMALALGAMGLLAFVALGLGLRPLHRPPAPRWLLTSVLLLGAIVPFALALLPPAHLDHPASLAGAGADFLPRALACFGFGGVLGIPVVLLTLLLDRGGHTTVWRAAAAALAAGLAANLALQVHCAIVHPAHLLLGHASLAIVYPALWAGLSRVVTARASAASGPWPTP